jgi:hypothetical protein
MEKHFKEYLENEGESIVISFKERKTELRAHYERIKVAIKESIEEDLKQLEAQEQ